MKITIIAEYLIINMCIYIFLSIIYYIKKELAKVYVIDSI